MIYNKDQREKIAIYAAQNTSTAASKRYKIGTQTVRKYRREFDLTVEKRDLESIYAAAMVDVREHGMSYNAAAKKHHIQVSNLTEKGRDLVEYEGVHPFLLTLGEVFGFNWKGRV